MKNKSIIYQIHNQSEITVFKVVITVNPAKNNTFM